MEILLTQVPRLMMAIDYLRHFLDISGTTLIQKNPYIVVEKDQPVNHLNYVTEVIKDIDQDLLDLQV